MMNILFRPLVKVSRPPNFALRLLNEMNNNLERYYVIDQRGFISAPFDLEDFQDARHYSGMTFPREVYYYAEVLETFNKLFRECREFEEMYSSGIQNKTHANAEILHAKKEALELRLKDIQGVIVAAQKALRPCVEKH